MGIASLFAIFATKSQNLFVLPQIYSEKGKFKYPCFQRFYPLSISSITLWIHFPRYHTPLESKDPIFYGSRIYDLRAGSSSDLFPRSLTVRSFSVFWVYLLWFGYVQLETVSRDLSNQQSSKQFSVEGEFLKSREFMGSDFFTSLLQQNQQSPVLARYRSAPSSFLAALLDSTADNSSSGDESEALFSAIWNGSRDPNQKGSDNDSSSQMQHQMKQDVGAESEARPGRFSNGQVGYESAVAGGGGAVVGSGTESQGHLRMNSVNGANSSNLVRQSSSPAGFCNGFGVMGEVGNYSSGHKTNSIAASGLSNSNNHLNFSSGQSSSPRFMPSIPENGSIGAREHRKSRNTGEFESAFSHETWNESSPSNGLKRNHDGNLKMFSSFNGLENQNGEGRKNVSTLVHHRSLPKTSSSSMGGEVEKFNFLQFQQDTVPCQVRAKRGCATHPRSIAERMRRTRISEKMKKLQDLFPTMDRQTSTADMLDLAVEYIKDLQKQVQTLTETKTNCVCLLKHHAKSPAAT